MKLRKILVNGFYWYLLLATTIVLFLFIAGFYYIDIDNPGSGLFHKFLNVILKFEALLLAYHLLGLFLIILFKRKETGWTRKKFILIAVTFFILFILPSMLVLIPWAMDIVRVN
jgi:hypothetical protein